MDIERLDFADTGAVQECHDVLDAAHRADDPAGPRIAAQIFAYFLEHGWTGDPGEGWVARDTGVIAGWYRLALPDLENLDRARLTLIVRPECRRHGIGGQLLRHAAASAAGAGRAMLSSTTLDGSAGEAFARAAGARPLFADVRRVLTISEVPPGRLDELRAEAERAATGYSLVTWTGPVPAELLGPVAGMLEALEDAPNTAGTQRAVWDAARVDDRINRISRTADVRRYFAGARHDATGDLVALTQVEVDPGDPAWGHQGMTAVAGPHRGHRLGLLVKAVLTRWIMTAEPLVQRIHTNNADNNTHMVAINDALGYRAGPTSTWWTLDLS